MEQFTFKNLVVVVVVLGRIALVLGACGLLSHFVMKWWEADEVHRKRVAPIKARVLRRQRAKEKTRK